MLAFAAIELVLIVPAALIVLAPAPEPTGTQAGTYGPRLGAPVLGLRPNVALAALCCAGFLC